MKTLNTNTSEGLEWIESTLSAMTNEYSINISKRMGKTDLSGNNPIPIEKLFKPFMMSFSYLENLKFNINNKKNLKIPIRKITIC